ncbi:hypothetical protein LCGC14_2843150, partial [marine sediment metagenome]
MRERPLAHLGRVLWLVLPPIAVMGLIYFLSAQTDEEQQRAFWEILLRKLAHVSEYALLTYLWWRALRHLDLGRLLPVAAAAVLSLAYAVSDELHQTLVAGRHGTPVDVLIDAVGIGIASALVLWIYARRRTVGPS